MSNIQLYNGDCLNILKTFTDNLVDCIITSPSYRKYIFKKINEENS
jgi:DNA modification methylase